MSKNNKKPKIIRLIFNKDFDDEKLIGSSKVLSNGDIIIYDGSTNTYFKYYKWNEDDTCYKYTYTFQFVPNPRKITLGLTTTYAAKLEPTTKRGDRLDRFQIPTWRLTLEGRFTMLDAEVFPVSYLDNRLDADNNLGNAVFQIVIIPVAYATEIKWKAQIGEEPAWRVENFEMVMEEGSGASGLPWVYKMTFMRYWEGDLKDKYC